MQVGFWVRVQNVGPDIGQFRHKLDSGAPFPFVLPVKKWVNIDEDRVLAMYGFASKGDDAGGSDQGHIKFKDLKKKKPQAHEQLVAHAKDVVAKAKVYCETQAKQQPEKWAVSEKEPRADAPAEPPSMLDRITKGKGKG